MINGAGAAKIGKKKTGKTGTIPAPTGDLVLVSAGADTSGFLVNARDSLALDVPFANIQDAIDKINAKSNEFGRPISVSIVDHGNVGLQGMGCGEANLQADNFMDIPANVAGLNQFTAGVRGKVSSINLYGCNVAADGGAFIQKMATDANAPVSAYTGSVYCTEGRIFGYWWLASDGGNKSSKNP